MAVLALVLAAGLTAAARKAASPMPCGDDSITAAVVGQGQTLHAAVPNPEPQYPLTQTCSRQPTHGTAVRFVATPAEAASKARKDKKLTFLLHISGNFEDADFT
jgi:hypothetical protein